MSEIYTPVGPYERPGVITNEQVIEWGRQIGAFPHRVRETVNNFTIEQLNTKTLLGKWTVAQVIHHLADSHMNAFIRMKLALTEDLPTIKPYNESFWAGLTDGKDAPVEFSFSILDGVHSRWAFMSDKLTESDLRKEFFHPESHRRIPVGELFALYTWHGNHHLAHIQLLKNSKGW